MTFNDADEAALNSYERVVWACVGLEMALDRAKEPDSPYGGPEMAKKAIQEWRDALQEHCRLVPNNFMRELLSRLAKP